MDSAMIIEGVGYLGSALVLVSFLMASVVKLRVVNSIGSTIFAVYALIIRSYPTAVMNVCLLLINLYYLWKLRNKAPNYRLVKLAPDEGFVSFFLDSYGSDIAACFPGRDWKRNDLNFAFMVCHGADPAGLLLGTERDGLVDVALDYSTPAYRDSSEGRYLLEHLPEYGVRKLHYERAERQHVGYLKKMGYREKNGVFERTL